MVVPTELELLREATQLRLQCSDYLVVSKELQDQRWELLRRVIQDAADQYQGMRHDVVEERLADQGAPVWVSVALTLLVSLTPVTVLTGRFISALTGSAQKLLTRADRKLQKALPLILEREKDTTRRLAAIGRADVAFDIQRTEQLVARFTKAYEPELANILQDGAQELGKIAYRHVFETQSEGREFSQSTDVPMVVVKQTLNKWVDTLVQVEDTARSMLRVYINDLFDIAIAKDPGKEAEKKDLAAATKEAEREPRVAFRKPVAKLPKSNKAAMDELSYLRDELEPAPIENRRTASSDDLRELQLMAEALIWASTYDFSWKRGDITRLTPFALEPAPLPKGLWKRLVTRYIDPDEGKSYKEVGPLDRLGTKKAPFIDTKEYTPKGLKAEKPFTPEVRLSHYFSNVLYPEIFKHNNKIVETFRRV